MIQKLNPHPARTTLALSADESARIRRELFGLNATLVVAETDNPFLRDERDAVLDELITSLGAS